MCVCVCVCVCDEQAIYARLFASVALVWAVLGVNVVNNCKALWHIV